MSSELAKSLTQFSRSAKSRTEFWIQFLNEYEIKTFAEIGVWRGDFAEAILRGCPLIENYYMIDPWRPLDDWNKPANVDAPRFEDNYEFAMARTEFAADRRKVIRAETREAISDISDASLDAAYIDGDHTLRGIAIDLICVSDKVSESGFISGDDFAPSIWQHDQKFEPTLVFPFATYFAEAVNRRIYGLPFNQFLIAKQEKPFVFEDISGVYGGRDLRSQLVELPHE